MTNLNDQISALYNAPELTPILYVLLVQCHDNTLGLFNSYKISAPFEESIDLWLERESVDDVFFFFLRLKRS